MMLLGGVRGDYQCIEDTLFLKCQNKNECNFARMN